ncbi:MAG TPA: hypothetical protein PLH19_13900 [Anaerolineae bacterium]|nr:hypothetical protein [Anaerolineae bacterium]HQH39609.1 hypothetical protein [Anaerolineae bacterium]
MMTYVNHRLEKAARGYVGAAVMTGLIFGGMTILQWSAYLSDPLEPTNPPFWFLVLSSFVDIVIVGTFGYAASVICTEVQADEVGLKLKTCLFRWHFVPWSDVKGVSSWIHKSQFNPKGNTTFVEIRQGISFLHYSPVKGTDGQVHWSLGVTLMASGENYDSLVKLIRDKLWIALRE